MAAIPNPRSAFDAEDSKDATAEEPTSKSATEGRDPVTGQFLPGHSGGSKAGRKKGARARWSEAFMADVEEAWQDMGAAAIRRALFNDPAGTVRALIGILPKQAKLEITTPTDSLSDERLAEMLEIAERMAGLRTEQARVIEGAPTPLPAPVVTIETLATPPTRSPGRDAAAAARRADLHDQAAAATRLEPARPAAAAPCDIDPQTLF